MDFVPCTDKDKELMLKEIGVDSIEALLADIPESLKKFDLKLPKALSEMELVKELKAVSEENINVGQYASFLGAGAYEHFIPSVVNALASRGEFVTSYTPYQAEVSQGTLQAIYEFQSMICELTVMDVANASMYDGASALAEAALLSIRHTCRRKIVISQAVHPEYRQVVKTYLQCLNIEIIEIPAPDGTTDIDALKTAVDDGTASLLIQMPNFFGCLEEINDIAKAAHKHGALFIACVNPISLGIIKPPGEYGADIAVGEGQSVGNPLYYGGPYIGFFAVKKELMRKIPGRIAGATTDAKGRRAFVLTLQAREQHIRRQKATSNICTNQALCALRTCIYLSILGKQGLAELARLNLHKSHYAMEEICKLKGFEPLFKKPFFNEFAIRVTDDRTIDLINESLLKERIIGGLDLARFYPALKDSMLLCVTETKCKDDIDRLVSALVKR
ncbi:MAG TPA: aminomethyl-transferring glycine dehydrogenase subunit GcvPA [Candidatus Brocadiia bacterium]|nr:aminomethyl-transferring glycine dehydrogenase subunit GcvPA [Candidatus Brocadiales bacterium]